jgi:spore coat polysaccharide biosynthesis protein SpsF
MPKICATIEARMTSTRLPGKVLLPVVGRPLLELMIERLQRVPSLDGVVVATTVNSTDDPIVQAAERMGVGCHRGSEFDVLGRVLGAAQSHAVDIIVETTGDCPLIDPQTIERVIQAYNEGGADYVTNTMERSYPRGMDVEVFATSLLADAAARYSDLKNREHVSLSFYTNPDRYRCRNLPAPPELTADYRLTVDEPADYELIRAIFEALYPHKRDFSLADIIALLKARPDLAALNTHVQQKVV